MLRFVLVLVLLALAATGSAHHSPVRYLEDQVVAVYGTVVKFDWRNPHVYLIVEDEDQVEWLFETNSTSNLRRSGWTKESLTPGDKVTVRAHPNRDPEKTQAFLISATDANSNVLQGRVGRQVVAATEKTTDLNGVWQGDPTLAFDFLFGMIDHPMTEKATLAQAQYDESMDPIAECVTWPTPRLVAWGAFYLIELEVSEDAVLFRSEFDNLERTIHMDGRAHPEDGERTNQGHSIGWWEGDTLVVDTTLFSDHISPVADGMPSGAQKHVIEKYTLNEGGTLIDVEVWVEDPEYLAEPFSAKLVWNYSPQLEMLGFDCDPEVSRRFAE